jgi:hypothetical protein
MEKKLISLKNQFEELKPKYPVISDVWIKIINSRIDIVESTYKQAEEILNHIKNEDEPLMNNINDRKLMLMLYLMRMNTFLYINNT